MAETSSKEKYKLSDAERARIERNKVKAMHLRQAKLVTRSNHPYAQRDIDQAIIKVQGKKYIDSGGGFLIEEEAVPIKDGKQSETVTADATTKKSIIDPSDEAITIPITFQDCEQCGDKFLDSYLYDNFGYSVCDKCRDPDEKHCLITKTEAKVQFFLKDCDLDKREPLLKFITRKNPHNVRWGEMKLYLFLQIEKRALEVWGSEEELLKQQEEREDKRELGKIKKFKKQMKVLRMDVRSSLYDKTKSASHTHEFGPDTYNEDDDNYTHSCLTCEYVETYEKM